MKMTERRDSDASRLEDLWAGEFGDAYIQRNINVAAGREGFWNTLFAKYSVRSVLEIGCNVGANLQWICKLASSGEVYGVDINKRALERLRSNLPSVNAIRSPARNLPFRDNRFDLVFTAGVLIHQSNDTLPIVMAEIVRCARRYVLCIEYFAEETVEIPYRGQPRALFKRDYGRLYEEIFSELKLLEHGMLTREQGWDDVTFWLFEKMH